MLRQAITVCLFTPSVAVASESRTVVGGSEIASMVISMLIVIGAIFALGWLYSRSRLAVSGARDVINVVASRALGTKERLILVEVADKQLLVGMTSSQIQTLHVFDNPVVTETTTSEDNASFGDRLRATLAEKLK
ncbi:MAG: flagellar biosynthetic protein FliO [Pseudomonadota bacterium]